MQTSMLDYTKEILKKVSFDAQLFAKELAKAVELLKPDELDELKRFTRALCQSKPELEASLIYIQ
ncbi:MAG: hypothetical protein ACTIKA_03490 [Psychroflexus halocasei]|uniref:hypothetical protein n=1 Tax=Psychroflexus sp. S27 TaxID=1982757 RepID=UPI000C2AF2DD|nr:hypothetical protein [Psychroflexus sp. S27]PJX28414.1 hypothetical protein CAP47_00835 [Psychroflexus sp. S27]